MTIKEELIVAAASKVHEDWCLQELQGFYTRAQECLKNGVSNLGEALRQACFKGENKRNEVFLDVPLLLKYESLANNCLNDFNIFISLVNKGAIDIKRFTSRTLTKEEQIKAGEHYKAETSEENILRDFMLLSSESKKENLEAAVGAFNVYVELSKAGITIEQMENNPNIRNTIGLAIHTDWLKRNKNHSNKSLKVPYSELDEWTQSQDLTVFYALLEVVKQNIGKYKVEAVSGFVLPNYVEEEMNILQEIKRTIK